MLNQTVHASRPMRIAVAGATGRVGNTLIDRLGRDPVDVVAQMDVSVEDVGALGQLRAQLVVVEPDQLLRTLKCLLHAEESTFRVIAWRSASQA